MRCISWDSTRASNGNFHAYSKTDTSILPVRQRRTAWLHFDRTLPRRLLQPQLQHFFRGSTSAFSIYVSGRMTRETRVGLYPKMNQQGFGKKGQHTLPHFDYLAY